MSVVFAYMSNWNPCILPKRDILCKTILQTFLPSTNIQILAETLNMVTYSYLVMVITLHI